MADPERSHPPSLRLRVWVLRGLVILGLAATVFYFDWWARGGRITSVWLASLLAAAALYHWTQLLSSWIIYLAAGRRPLLRTDSSTDLSVDVFVTACGEDPALVRRALGAVVAMRGSHRSWLLDDGDDPRLARLAETLSVGYLTREGRDDAKAGNLNAALARTSSEIVVIFDIDHVPSVDFLERSLGHFADPDLGFAQVMLSFFNGKDSWFARAAAETTVDFFNPTSVGMDRLGSATLIGTNALIRRRALESIGGYQPGLAEDLATSIALHAAGWKSVYVAEPLAPGEAPADVSAWFTQQLKWARGVSEVLLTAYPRLFPQLTAGQRLSYAVRMTYYWAGPVAMLHMVFTGGVLIGGERVAHLDLLDYVVHLLPLGLTVWAIRRTALLCWRHPSVRVPFLFWRSLALVHATWPIYTLAWVMGLLRIPLSFRPTPKSVSAGLRWRWLMPQVAAAAFLTVATLVAFANPVAHLQILMAFSALQAGPQLILVWQAARVRAA